MSDWPRMLYRKGDEIEAHGLKCDTFVVDSAEEEREAKGWHRTPQQAHGEKPVDDEAPCSDDEKLGLMQEVDELQTKLKSTEAERDAAWKAADELRAELSKVDRDGDGKVGGSKPKLTIKAD